MVHIALGLVRRDRVDQLIHPRHTQRGDVDDLRLTTLEQGRSVCCGEQIDLSSQRTDIRRRAPIDTDPFVDDALAHQLLGQRTDRCLDLTGSLSESLFEFSDDLSTRSIKCSIALCFRGLDVGDRQLCGAHFFNGREDIVTVVSESFELHGLDRSAFCGVRSHEFTLQEDGFENPLLRCFKTSSQDFFGHLRRTSGIHIETAFGSASFHHHDGNIRVRAFTQCTTCNNEFKGGLVALIADEVALANLAAAEKKASNENELNFARIAKKQADSEHDRMVKANEDAEKKGGQRPVAQVEIDKAQLAADKAGISITAAEHEIALNKLNAAVTAAELRTYSVRAVFDGTVTKIYKHKGEAVRQGDPVAEFVNPKHVRIEGYVPLDKLRQVKEGAKVVVRLSDADLDHLDYFEDDNRKPFEGRITFVDEVSDPIDGTTRIFAEVENREKVEKQVKVESRVKFILRAGLEANMDIFVDDEPTTARSQPTKDLENARKELTPTSDQK